MAIQDKSGKVSQLNASLNLGVHEVNDIVVNDIRTNGEMYPTSRLQEPLIAEHYGLLCSMSHVSDMVTCFYQQHDQGPDTWFFQVQRDRQRRQFDLFDNCTERFNIHALTTDNRLDFS